jgi:hypothetical protein
LIDYKLTGISPDNLHVAVQFESAVAETDFSLAYGMDVTLEYDMIDLSEPLPSRFNLCPFRRQGLPVPFAADQDLLTQCQAGWHLLNFEPDTGSVQRNAMIIHLRYNPIQLHNPLWCNRLNARCHNLPLRQPVPAEADPVAHTQAGQVAGIRGARKLPQNPEFAGGRIYRIDGADRGIDQCNFACRHFSRRASGTDGHQLPNRHLTCGSGLSVDRYGRIGIKPYLHAIDTNTCKARDDANDTCTANAVITDARPPQTRPRGGCAGATDTPYAGGFQQNRVNQRGLCGARTLGVCSQSGQQDQEQACGRQGQRSENEARCNPVHA